MDVSGHRKRAIEAGQLAVVFDNDKKYEEALRKYTEACDIMMYVIKCNPLNR